MEPGPGVTHPARPGRGLEEAVADLFAADGYAVSRNVILTGRSGARYEVDVLAERDEGLVASRVAVECKHWRAPVGTDVVARVRMLREDLAATQAVVVCPGGWTPAAAHAAREHGVALWGEEALAARLGRAVLGALDATPAPPRGPGLPRRTSPERAAGAVRAVAGGVLGLGREHVAWTRAAWLPVHELRLACARPHGRLRPRVRVARLHVGYEGIDGTTLWSRPEPVAPAEVDLDAPVLPPLVTAADIRAAIERALRRRTEVTQPAARVRHEEALAALGVPAEDAEVTVEGAATLHVPVDVALLVRRGHERIVVLDGLTGHVDEGLSAAFTARLTAVAGALAPARDPTGGSR